MRYRALGNTGLQVSELAFGAMTFASDTHAIAKVDEKLAGRMLGLALDAGINLFDTADTYAWGESEEILGRALGSRRSEVLIATKVGFPTGPGPNDRGLSYRHVIESAEQSLRRLGTDWIDLLQIHKRDARTPIEETARALDDLVRRGLVRHVGFSNLCAWEAALAVAMQRERGWAPFVSAQMYYSLVGRDIEHEIVPFLEHASIGLLVYSPLAGGFLSGKYRSPSEGQSGDRRDRFDYPPVDPQRGAAVVEQLRSIAAQRGATPAGVALAWLLSKPCVTSIILGASKLPQLEQNLACRQIELTGEEVAALETLCAAPRPYPPAFYDYFPDH
jgi:aryl-alcohol dehydrogenase-like predicted oxidoreductase